MSFAFDEFFQHLLPMYARKQILPDNSYSHVFFRCHNKEFFLKPHHVKNYLLLLWAKFKKRYGIEIYEFIIMDNHAHLLLKAKSTQALGHFMRTVNSLLARYINRTFERDSQAIRERYKSPVIASMGYVRKVMRYIWLNRFKINKSSPLLDKYCSASWRVSKSYKSLEGFEEDERILLDKLLDTNRLFYPDGAKKIATYIRDLLNAAFGNLQSRSQKSLVHGHTIGDREAVAFRSELLGAFRRQKNPLPTWLQ